MTGGSIRLVVRLGLVQAAIGAMVVIMTSTLNRVMVVELALPAVVPGALVALHFLVQLALRPRLGHGSDRTGRRTPWIIGGMVLLALSAVGATASTLLIVASRAAGLAAAAVAFTLLGAGVSAAGTSLLALLAELVPAERRARAAATVWLMMIAGFVLTTVAVSLALDPFSLERLVRVTAVAGCTAVAIATLAIRGVERSAGAGPRGDVAGFAAAVRQVWADPAARAFAGFVFVSMLAYSAQDLILEPFAGRVFGLSPAESTRVSSLHQGGMLMGMIAAGVLAARWGSLRAWASAGCVASGAAFLALAASPAIGSVAALKAVVFALGVANGAFAIGAVGSMMALSVSADGRGAGVRMGVFGAAQAVAYGIGGFAGAAGSDVAARLLGDSSQGYTTVFLGEAVLFMGAATLARVSAARSGARGAAAGPEAGDTLLAAMG
jgi:BCD family chlorophyll transporter-like MFS transporter